jgi:hypothetical protein
MKAYLINPFIQTVVEIQIADANHPDHMKDMYGALNCDLFEVGGYISDNNRDCVFVDEEGLLGNLDEQRFFTMTVYDGEATVTLAGMGLVLGADDEGEATEPVTTLEEVRGIVKFNPDYT